LGLNLVRPYLHIFSFPTLALNKLPTECERVLRARGAILLDELVVGCARSRGFRLGIAEEVDVGRESEVVERMGAAT
jgi:hypothetical protein